MNTRLPLTHFSAWSFYRLFYTFLLLVSISTALAQTPTIRYVKAGATGNGSAWASASGDLQAMINASAAGDQVWMAQGLYKPGGQANTNRSLSFAMKNGVALYGGFAGSETTLSQRALSSPSSTTLSGDIGTANNNADNSYHVLNNPAGLTSSAILDGFLITGGNASASASPDNAGGGMRNNGNGTGNTCSPLIRNCIFQTNAAADRGGALYNAGYSSGSSNPSLINCLFLSNSANSLGGALYNDGSAGGSSNPSLINCSFLANSAPSGGAMGSVGYQGGSHPVLTNCVVFGNGGASTFTNGPVAFITTSYSLFEASAAGYNAGTGNLTTAFTPFVNSTDARLNACAPAINAGDNATYTTANGPTTDLAGNPRIFPSGGRIDMGAYEYQATPGLTLTAPSVNTATVGVAFSQPFTASGGSGPYSFSLASGSLPPGLTLATTGTLSGTPTQVGSFTLSVKATDATGCAGVSTPYVLTGQLDSPIRYVRAGAAGSGSSWADASGNLQGQINLVGAQQVWVAQGTYKPGPTGNTNRSLSFAMKNGITILGGFSASGSPTLSQRNPASFTTILSGDIGTLSNNADNSYHVLNNAGIDNSAVLDGFLIRDGYDNGQNASALYGGGICNKGSSPRVTNCIFQSNTSFLGGGMFNDNASNPIVTNCSFQSNTAVNAGGGMANVNNSRPTLINCNFQGNSARGGGAMINDNANPSAINCTFQGNSGSELGGAMFNTSSNTSVSSTVTLINCVVFDNGGANTFANNQSSVSATYSLLEASVTGYTDGGNNLTTSVWPFVSSTDVRLNSCAPAINTGSNAAYSAADGPATELAGNARVYPNGGRIDMGAYEYQAVPTTISLTAPSVNTTTVGVAFSQSFTASGGSGPYSYSLASGSLPTGLTLATMGMLSGTPTQVGRFTLTVLATDAAGCSGVSTPYILGVQTDVPIRYVRVGGVGSGSSWADASGDLQSQINLVGAQQVWVAQGSYKPGGNANTDRSLSFAMKSGVRILGGFPASGSPSLSQRNPGSFTTVLSGDIGTVSDPADNTYHVINNSVIDNTAVLDGFVIRDGNANGSSDQRNGGGMYNSTSSPTLTNCSFLSNSASYGGGIANSNSSPTLTNCSFLSNSAQSGGGLYTAGGDPTLTNCSFQGNTASSFNFSGGAVFSVGGNSRLINCVVWGNGGGNTFSRYAGDVIVTYSLLEASVAGQGYTDGGNNLTSSVSPFVSATDTRLNACSSAINAGNNAAYSAANGPATDLAGNARVYGSRIDMGAYEYQATPGLTLTAPSISTATVGVAFSQSFTASGSSGPYSFSLASGSLPPGLTLATTGVLSGTPTQAGSFTLTVLATDAAGCAGLSVPYTLTITQPAPILADLSPLLYARPSLVYGQSPLTVVVDVVELNSVATSGSLTVRLTKDPTLPLSFDASLSSLNGRAVQNSVWRFSDSDPDYYILTTSQPIAPGSQLSFGLSGNLLPGASTGVLTVSATVLAETLVEGRLTNNTDADKVEYFQQ